MCSILSISAQTQQNYTIKGIITDSTTRQPVGFATVVLKDSTTNVKAIAADVDGKFSLKHNKKGKYTLNVSYIGYSPMVSDVELGSSSVVDLGTVPLSAGIQLEAATVIGQLITSDIDKVAYNTAVDPETPSLTALEMMRKVPMLTVDGEDNIQLKGDGNYKILVNGKTNTMMSKNYKEVLRSMPASSIKSIEVITNPPAKYDAEGIAGIINIITERKTNNAYNGSLSLRGDQWGSVGGSGYIAASLGKFTLSANLSVGNYKRPESTSWSETYNEKSIDSRYVNSNSASKGTNGFNHLSVDASYEIDTFNLISLSLFGYMGNSDYNSENYTEHLNPDRERGQYYNNYTHSKNNFSSISGNIDWQRTFMKPDQTLTLSYRIDMGPGSSSYDSKLEGFGGYPSRNQRSDNGSDSGEHTFQIDYFDPLTKVHNIEVGAKFVLRPNYSNTFNEKFENDTWTEDPERKNDLDYMQYIMSAYGGYNLKLNKFSAKVGIRAEYTINTGTFKQVTNNEVFNRYFNVVPYITTSYKLNQSSSFRLGYTQRLQRPGIWYLNPYIDDEDPMNITTGNPNLDSEIRHSFDLSFNSFSQKGNISASLSANFGNNAIERVTTIDDNGVMFTMPENCGRRQNYSGYFYGGLNLLKGKMRLSLGANLGYSIVESIYNKELNNSGFNFGGNFSFYAQTWKNASVNAYVGYWSQTVGLQSKSTGQLYNSISISQGFLKDKKLRVNLNVSNPFETKKAYRYETFGVGYNSVSESINYARALNLSVQWNFGKSMTQVKKARRGINNDDKTGGGGGSEGGTSGGGGGQS